MHQRPCQPGKITRLILKLSLSSNNFEQHSYKKACTHSFLRSRGVPCGNGGSLVVSQWALFTGVTSSKGLIVGVDDPAGGSHFTHVEEHIPSRPHGGNWLHPGARSLTQLIVRIGADDPHAHVVHALREETDLGAGAGVVASG